MRLLRRRGPRQWSWRHGERGGRGEEGLGRGLDRQRRGVDCGGTAPWVSAAQPSDGRRLRTVVLTGVELVPRRVHVYKRLPFHATESRQGRDGLRAWRCARVYVPARRLVRRRSPGSGACCSPGRSSRPAEPRPQSAGPDRHHSPSAQAQRGKLPMWRTVLNACVLCNKSQPR